MNDKKITSRVVRAAPAINTPPKKHPLSDEKTLKQELKLQAAELRQVRLELKRLQAKFRLADKAKEQKQLIIESAGKISDGALFDDKGSIYAVTGISTDISERKQAEQALQESEERFRQLADAAFEGLVIHADGVILDVNTRLTDMLGHDPAELIDRPFWNFIDAKYHQLVKEKVSTSFVGRYEVELIHADGRHVPVEVSGRPLMWKGQPTRVASLRDITERRLAEQEMRESEVRYRTLFNGMTEGFALHEIICDEKGQPVDYRFLDINPAFERLTGLKRAEVVGRTHNEVLPGDPPVWVDSYGKVALTGEPLTSDAYSAALERHYEVFSYQPMPGQFAVIFLDVTEKKLAEQALHKSEEKARNQAAELETIFATLADSVIVYGPDAVAIRANDSAKALLGFDPTGAGLKKNMTSAGTRSETRLSATARALQGEVVRDAEFDFNDPQGERRTVSASSSPLRDAQGQIIGAVTVSRDITERKKQQEMTEWLASFPKHNPSPVVEINLDRTINYLNPAAQRIFPDLQANGWQHPFLIDLEAIVDHLRSDDALTTARDIMVGESYYRQTISYLPDSQKLRIYSIDITGRVKAEAALRQARDELDLRVSERTQELLSANKLLQNEIMERLRAEGAMKESERRYRTLFESSPDSVMLIDLEQKILFANKQAASMHGYRQTKKLVGMQFTDLVAPDEREAVHQTISKTSEAGASRDIEYQIQMKDGAHFPAELKVTTVNDDQDRPNGFLMDIRDITERKWAEESLHQANTYNRSLIEASLDPLVTITPHGKIGDVNQATEKVTGFTREELIGTDFHTYFSNPEMARIGYQQAFETGNVRSYELEIRHKDGHLTPVLYNASTYRDERGKVLGVFAVARDITDRKQFETQLVQAEKHAVVGRMVGSITHEINNPLQTIKNCLYLMQQDVPADSPMHEPLEMVTSETRRLTTLVGQLRELYRPKIAVEKHPEELLDILEEAHALLIPHMNNAGVEWHPLTGLQRCYINCVRDQVLEVFLNLSMNAIQSMQSHGGTLFVDMGITDDWVGVIFKDTGPGIPKEMMLHLFEPFMTTKASGLGLGLSITYGIVQRHGGQIQVDNQPGKGATFTVLLPLHDHDGDEEESKHANK